MTLDQDRSAGVRGIQPLSLGTLVFVRMWAVAHIVHLVAASSARLDTVSSALVVGTAFAVLVAPRSGRLFAAMLVLQLVDYVVEMPWSPDHWALLALVNLAILATMALRRTTSPAVLPEAFPAARLLVLVTYSFAALAKYNTSFLDPLTSCANAIAQTASFGLSERFPAQGLLPVLIMATEASVPIMLAVPALRRHGVRIAMMFHFSLSVSPAFAVVDFTAALFALFLLFLSPDDLERVVGRLRALGARSAIVRDARRKPPVTAAVGFAVLGGLGYLAPQAAGAVVWLASEGYLVIVLGAVLLTWRGSRGAARFGRLRWVHVPVLALALVWALSPYLGLRTTGVFTMFSNLRTEGTESNHLFLPNARVTGWQDDMVVITESTDPTLEAVAGKEIAVPLLALRRLATDDPTLEVTGEVDGQEVVYGPGPGQTRLEPLGPWAHHLLLFRPVSLGETPFCSVS